MDLRPKFRLLDGYVVLAGSADSRRVYEAQERQKMTATARHEPCPSPERVMASARLAVRKLGGNLEDKVFFGFCSIRLADDLWII